jgi:uroporphyrinogen-III synthase
MARVLVTRPMPAAARSAARIEALGHRVHVAPLLFFRPLPLARGALPAPGDVGAVAVTSARSLEAMAGAGRLAPYLHLPLFAVGAATGQAAREAGFEKVAEAGGTLSDLVRLIAERRSGGRVLYLAGRERSGDLAGELSRKGFECRLVETYTMERLDAIPDAERSALAADDDGHPVLAPVYSGPGGKAAGGPGDRRRGRALRRGRASRPVAGGGAMRGQICFAPRKRRT